MIRAIKKMGILKRQEDEILALRKLNQTYKQQVDSLLELNKRMIEKLAGLGIRVKVERTGVSFEAIK